MRKLSAQYIFTNKGPALKRGIVTVRDDGTVTSVEDTGGELKETSSIEFHNGIIVPGFVNCHTHLELSHLKGCIPRGKGLAEFIRLIRLLREHEHAGILSSAVTADNEMFNEGIVLCADICNTSTTFSHKKTSKIKYLNLLEVFGLNPLKAEKRIMEASALASEADSAGLYWQLVPHSVYSVSLSLLRLIKERSESNKVTSLHFMESKGEMFFLSIHRGPIRVSYDDSGLTDGGFETPRNHITAILDEVTSSGNLILVHNTYAEAETVKSLAKRKNLYWCLCPNSNLYIEDKTPPLSMLVEHDCKIVVGTDSLASNKKLSMLEELRTLQSCSPDIPLEKMIRWATLNGAKALGEDKTFGSIEPGKKPGLLLIQNANLHDLKLTPESSVKKVL